MKWLRYAIEAFFTLLIYCILRALPLRYASGFGGWVARTIGPLSKVHQVADYNLQRAMAELSDEQRAQYLLRMWDNLGRVFCEYPHLKGRAMLRHIEIDGDDILKRLVQQNKPVLLVSGHIGNWELLPVVAAQRGVPLHLLYRAANNQVVEWLVARMRRPYTLGLYAKGMQSARGVIKALRKAEPVAMLVDQKTNDGIAVPFFGDEAMTIDAVAHFVQKYDAVVVPARCVRVDRLQFRIFVEEPMVFASDDDSRAIMMQVNAVLERWIREDPAQWFWVHKRWPHSKLFAKGRLQEASP